MAERTRDGQGGQTEGERALTFTIPALPAARRTSGKIDRAKAPTLKLVGYYTQGKVPNWARMGEYHAWKDHVRLHAPPELLTLRPHDEATRVRLDVACFFAHGTHPDPENVRKGIVDALFPGGDKWVYGQHDHPRYDANAPRAEVTVTVFAGNLSAAPQKSGKRAPASPKALTEPVAPEVPAAVPKTAPTSGSDKPKAKRPKRGAAKKATRPDKTVQSPAKRTFWGIVKNAFVEASAPPPNRSKRAKKPPSGAAKRQGAASKPKRRD